MTGQDAGLLFRPIPAAELDPLEFWLVQLLIQEAAGQKVSKRADNRSSNSSSPPLRSRVVRHWLMVEPMYLCCVATSVLVVARREILHRGPRRLLRVTVASQRTNQIAGSAGAGTAPGLAGRAAESAEANSGQAGR